MPSKNSSEPKHSETIFISGNFSSWLEKSIPSMTLNGKNLLSYKNIGIFGSPFRRKLLLFHMKSMTALNYINDSKVEDSGEPYYIQDFFPSKYIYFLSHCPYHKDSQEK